MNADRGLYCAYPYHFQGPIHPRIKRRVGDRLAVGAMDAAKGRQSNPGATGCKVTAAAALSSSTSTSTSMSRAAIAAIAANAATVHVDFEVQDDFLRLSLATAAGELRPVGLEVCAADSAEDAARCACRSWAFTHMPDQSTSWHCADASHASHASTTSPASRTSPAATLLRASVASAPEAELADPLTWRPSPNPADALWRAVAAADVAVVGSAGTTLEIRGAVAAGAVAVRFAWKAQACCDTHDKRYANGTSPCAPMSCGIASAKRGNPPDPFFLVCEHAPSSSVRTSEKYRM